MPSVLPEGGYEPYRASDCKQVEVSFGGLPPGPPRLRFEDVRVGFGLGIFGCVV